MGNTYAYVTAEKDWYVYKRRIDTDGYEKQPVQTWKNISKETALNRFKHEMYAYSMGKYDYDNNTKAIYLYYGSTRLIRVGIMNNQLVSTSEHNLQEFLEAEEELSPGRSPYLAQQFQKKWFRNYARLNVNTVGWVLNQINNIC